MKARLRSTHLLGIVASGITLQICDQNAVQVAMSPGYTPDSTDIENLRSAYIRELESARFGESKP